MRAEASYLSLSLNFDFSWTKNTSPTMLFSLFRRVQLANIEPVGLLKRRMAQA